MIKYLTPMGKVTYTDDFFESLVSSAVAGCYGVVGTASSDPADGIMSFILGDEMSPRGVSVRAEDNRLAIELHVKILYGISVRTICENIRERVVWAVESATDLKVGRIDISIDDIVADNL